MIVVLGHGLARPVLVDGTDLELLEVAAELHSVSSSQRRHELGRDG